MTLSRISLCLLALAFFATPSFAGRWIERYEFRAVNGKTSGNYRVGAFAEISLSNAYGDIEVIITNENAERIEMSGDYSSESENHAEIQFLVKTDNRYDIFFDGPAKFKTQDHVWDNHGKPLTYEWFKDHVGVIPYIRKGEGEAIIVGDAIEVKPRGNSVSASSWFWGDMTLGPSVAYGEGASIGREPAQAKLVLRIPASRIGQLEVSAKKDHQVTVSFEGRQNPRIQIQPDDRDPHKVKISNLDRPCASVVKPQGDPK